MEKCIPLFLVLFISACAVSPAQVERETDNELCLNHGTYAQSAMFAGAAENYRREIEHRKLMTPEEWDLASRKTIRIGMSRCAMYASWGKPDRENRSVGSFGEHIQHVYNSGYRYIRPKYVYTRNGKVSSWQD